MTLNFHRPAGAVAALMLGMAAFAAHAQATPPDDMQTPSLMPPPAPPMSSTEFSTPPLSDSFDELDRDKDGAVTQGEASRNQQVAMSFKRLDESRDGTLDLAEFAQLRTPLHH
jgi:hypothetical protein